MNQFFRLEFVVALGVNGNFFMIVNSYYIKFMCINLILALGDFIQYFAIQLLLKSTIKNVLLSLISRKKKNFIRLRY